MTDDTPPAPFPAAPETSRKNSSRLNPTGEIIYNQGIVSETPAESKVRPGSPKIAGSPFGTDGS
jgi:hypothetical protein